MRFIIPNCMILSGIVVGILIGVGKTQQAALLIIVPLILYGLFILAYLYVERRNKVVK